MPFPITFTRNRGAVLADDVSKSQYGGVMQLCKDLQGCNSVTHIATQLSFATNVRSNCQPPALGLNFSGSGLVSVLPHSADALDANGVDGAPLSGVDMSFEDLVEWALDHLATPLTTPAAAQTRFGGNTASNWRYNANGLEYYDSIQKYIAAQVGFAIVDPVVDNCGIQVGTSLSVSGSVNAFDTETCKPVLLWQGSVKFAANNGIYGGLPAGRATLVDDIINALWVEQITGFQIPAAGIDNAACAGLFTGIRGRRDSHLNEPTEIGI